MIETWIENYFDKAEGCLYGDVPKLHPSPGLLGVATSPFTMQMAAG